MRYRLAVVGGVLIITAILTVPKARWAVRLLNSRSQASIDTQDTLDSRLISLIRELRSETVSQRTAAKAALIQLSNESPRNREAVIKELLGIIKSSNRTLNFIKDPENYLGWQESTEILGSIRATEAIDDLIHCLDCNDGKFGLSIERFPAAAALVKMGEDSVPKLSEAIKDQHPMRRYLSSLALAQIGGDEAKHVLQTAMRKERDKDLASTMRNLLQRWNVSKT
jgi:HEAT repeat protein